MFNTRKFYSAIGNHIKRYGTKPKSSIMKYDALFVPTNFPELHIKSDIRLVCGSFSEILQSNWNLNLRIVIDMILHSKHYS